MRHQSLPARGYALVLVLMVLALLSVGIGTLFVFQESSAKTTGSLLERRRVFYACDGISRAATVLAQNYVLTAQPTTAGLIRDICTKGGNGCCAAVTAGGSCNDTSPVANLTVLTAESPDSALPKIVPVGYRIMELQLESLAEACTVDGQCAGGSCIADRCRTTAPLPNGPFSGMNARQDTIAIGILAEHSATTKFRCATRQTLTLGKIAMFQFFLFSDSAITDWHPGPAMRASGRLHANGDLHIGGNLKLQRVTASGDLRIFASPAAPCTGATCTSTALISTVDAPNFTASTDFNALVRKDATWRKDALDTYNGNALDKAHGVPRLQLSIVGKPEVQKGYNGVNGIIPNTNAASGVPMSNARLLLDPVRTTDASDIVAQKFSAKADIRIINGVWYLNNAGSTWPGTPIWSDHGTYITKLSTDLVNGQRVGQTELREDLLWPRTPRRYSYYAMKAATDRLILDDPAEPDVRPVISYGSLFKDNTASHAPLWRPGVRTLKSGNRDSWCEALPGGNITISHGLLDAMALVPATTPCPTAAPNATLYSRGAGVLSAARSGFRDGFGEFHLCGLKDKDDNEPTCTADRREPNVMPLNFDIGAFQQALADNTVGELGSYFCTVAVGGTIAVGGDCLMGRPFNGIVYVTNPYPGSEDGYGIDGGQALPAPLPTPVVDDLNLIDGVVLSTVDDATDGGVGNWGSPRLSLLRDNPSQPAANRVETRDDEVLALPFPLCSRALASTLGTSGTAMTTGGYTYRRPQCFTDPSAQATTWVTGVRVINARVVNARVASVTPPAAIVDNAGSIKPFTQAEADTQLPDFLLFDGKPASPVGRLPLGLSFVTNQPLYVVGDVNITSGAFEPVVSTATPAPWVPVLLAGDTIHPLSNGWDDSKARWAISMGSDQARTGKIASITSGTLNREADAGKPREAQVTRWYMQVLSGWGQPVVGQAATGIQNYPFFNEDWRDGAKTACNGSGDFTGGCPAIIYGSLVIGHNRVYTRWPFNDRPEITRAAPRRDWGFDQHLNDLTKQPPGAPIFDVSAVKQWSRN